MLPALGTAGGGLLAGTLGQIGDTLSAPRRMAWQALGLPEHGSELLAQTFGMDASSPLTQALGIGAEMVGDPLTYAGMFAGGPLGKLWSKASGSEALLGHEINALSGARRAAQEAMIARELGNEATRSRYAEQALNLRGVLGEENLAGAAGGMTRTYNSFHPEVLDDLERSGLGFLNQQGQLETLGINPPQGMAALPFQTAQQGRMHGSMLNYIPNYADLDMTIPLPPMQARGYQNLDPLLPDELNFLRQRVADELGTGEIAGPSKWRQLLPQNAGRTRYGLDRLMDEFAHEQALAANTTRPMPTLLQAMMDTGTPYSAIPQSILDAPVPQAFELAQQQLAPLLARQRALQMTGGDYARIAGVGGLGGYLGGTLGFSEGGMR